MLPAVASTLLMVWTGPKAVSLRCVCVCVCVCSHDNSSERNYLRRRRLTRWFIVTTILSSSYVIVNHNSMSTVMSGIKFAGGEHFWLCMHVNRQSKSRPEFLTANKLHRLVIYVFLEVFCAKVVGATSSGGFLKSAAVLFNI